MSVASTTTLSPLNPAGSHESLEDNSSSMSSPENSSNQVNNSIDEDEQPSPSPSPSQQPPPQVETKTEINLEQMSISLELMCGNEYGTQQQSSGANSPRVASQVCPFE